MCIRDRYYDFSKIYRFCDKEQKKILRLYFSKFDIAIIKRAFRRAFNHGDRTAEEKELRSMVQRYTDIPLEKLAETGTVPEILEALKGTEYYKVLQDVYKRQLKRYPLRKGKGHPG